MGESVIRGLTAEELREWQGKNVRPREEVEAERAVHHNAWERREALVERIDALLNAALDDIEHAHPLNEKTNTALALISVLTSARYTLTSSR
jgi:primosomal protein N''